jgi:hypothetical protein
MRDIKSLRGSSLRWFKVGWVLGSYELIGEDAETYATLVWKGVWTEKALITTAYGEYTLRWRGFLRRHVPIVNTASGQEMGRLRLGFGDSGTFELENGRKYRFKCTSMLRSRYAILDDLDEIIATIRFTGWLGLGRTGGEVFLGPMAVRDRDLLILLATGWYTAVMISKEAAASVAAGG